MNSNEVPAFERRVETDGRDTRVVIWDRSQNRPAGSVVVGPSRTFGGYFHSGLMVVDAAYDHAGAGELLRYLATNSGRAVSRDEILRRVWRINPNGVESRTIDMHIARLREKLHDDGENPRIVLTVRGKGYMFAAEHH